MDDLRRMVIFYHVVDSNSFSGAARQLGIARSAISRHISLLEKSIGVRLLNRTTRRLSLTEAGETYYQSCARIVAEAEMAEHRVSKLQDEPVGTLKVTAPSSLGDCLVTPLVCAFMQRYTSLSVELLLDDQVVDMVKEGIDVSIRAGWLDDSTFVARKLGNMSRILCVSPGYAEKYGKPETPAELAGHECIIFTRIPAPYHWIFTKNKREERIQVKGRLKTNNASAMRTAILDGAGIGVVSSFLAGGDIKAGRLEHLLPEYDAGVAGIYAVYQNRNYQQAKIRLFIDFIEQQLKHRIKELTG